MLSRGVTMLSRIRVSVVALSGIGWDAFIFCNELLCCDEIYELN